ncbi:MAG: arsenate reductase-like glutaredoxin family protein [Pseudohongiellaceae bacterium]|jgi:arsenate reductase-like glutaredoxin family protein
MDDHNIEAKETVPASRKLGQSDAAAIAKKATLVVVAKGKKVSEFKPDGKASKEIVEAMLGPTGNLRAPTIVYGKTVLVGFNEEVYEKRLG